MNYAEAGFTYGYVSKNSFTGERVEYYIKDGAVYVERRTSFSPADEPRDIAIEILSKQLPVLLEFDYETAYEWGDSHDVDAIIVCWLAPATEIELANIARLHKLQSANAEQVKEQEEAAERAAYLRLKQRFEGGA